MPNKTHETKRAKRAEGQQRDEVGNFVKTGHYNDENVEMDNDVQSLRPSCMD